MRFHLSKRLLTAALLLVSPAAFAQEPPIPISEPSEIEKLRQELDEQRAALEQLSLENTLREVEQQKAPPFRIYGFIDIGLQKTIVDDASIIHAILPSDSSSFVFGNLNIYLDAQPTEHWKALVEIRFTNQPHGADNPGAPGVPYSRTSTSVFDSGSASGGWAQIEWGALVLERAYLEWRHSDLLQIRAGSWLTPYGIWNVDHGSPTLIPLMLPQMIVGEFFPTRQLGVQALGKVHLKNSWDLDWSAYVSNGRQAGQLDPTEDKALGGRVAFTNESPFRLALGSSFYLGSYADEHRQIVSVAPWRIEREIMVAYDEIGVAADLSLDVGRLRLRSEVGYRSIRYEDGKRDLWYGVPGSLQPDHYELEGYVLAAYQLPWLGLEPYVFFEGSRMPGPFGEGVALMSGGMNIHFSHVAQLKLQAAQVRFVGDWSNSVDNTTLLGARAVMAF